MESVEAMRAVLPPAGVDGASEARTDAGAGLDDAFVSSGESLHILVLADRDWTHPQGGGTGTNLFGQVMRWLAWGHRVTVVAAGFSGAPRVERHDRLTIHRVGGRATVFPVAIWRQTRGLVPDADVVLEIINGITFLTPLWMRTPRVALVHHVHRDHYVAEMGRKGKLAALALETAPLRWLYGNTRFITVSHATAEEVADHGIEPDRISVNHNGVECDAFHPGPKAAEPTLLYLGRLKRYKRIEILLEAMTRAPVGTLHIAGDGDYREEVEASVADLGLEDRVVLHGAVDEPTKLRLLQEAWVHLTASACEGWGLTVMEAAACGTPTVAVDAGGLGESVLDGETGILVDDAEGMASAVNTLIAEEPTRRILGDAALARARSLTWDRTAAQTLETLHEERTEHEALAPKRTHIHERFRQSDAARAGALAVAVMFANFVQLIFTIVFARLLGASGYGELAALLSAFLILSVLGSAMQITVAREVSIALADGDDVPAAAIRRWLKRLGVVCIAVAAASFVLRDAIATSLGVDAVWAAALVLPTGCIWLVVSVQRGVLQGQRRYRLVAGSLLWETGGRLVFGLALWAVGLGVTGAFLGTAIASVVTMVLLGVILHRELPREPRPQPARELRLRAVAARTTVPLIALTFLAILQNVDVIVVRHTTTAADAGSYAAAAVAAKAVIWIAIGLGMYLLPEAARRARAGGDARPTLVHTLALIAAISLPMLIAFTFAAKPLLGWVYGDDLTAASSALPLLGLAMTLLACAYIAVQYLLALGRSSFLWLLGLAAIAEPLALSNVGAHLIGVALTLLILQAIVAVGILVMSLRRAQPALVLTG